MSATFSYNSIPAEERYERWLVAARACAAKPFKDLLHAAKCYRQALAIKDTDADVWYELGTLYMYPNVLQYDQAYICMDRTLALKADHPFALARMGECLKKMPNPDHHAAVALYEKALDAAPTNYKIYNKVIHVMLKDPRCDYDRAIALCYQGMRNSPEWTAAWVLMALLAEMKGHKQGYVNKEVTQLDALEYINRALELHPDKPSYQLTKQRLLDKLAKTQSHLPNPLPLEDTNTYFKLRDADNAAE